MFTKCSVGRDSSVGIATRYGLDDPGIESRWGGRDFPHPPRPAPGPTQPPVQWVPVSFPGVKRLGRGADHSPPSKRRGHERGRAIPVPTLWAFGACFRENLYLTLLPPPPQVF
jgi:hypothetical protein